MLKYLWTACFIWGIALIGYGQTNFTGPRVALAEKGLPSLPNDAGQFWMVYDLTPYTGLYPNLPAPEQNILNWILYDTEKDFWFREPFGTLSSTRQKLYVYHTSQVQQYISNVLDRFMDAEKKKIIFRVQIILLDSPDWRTKNAQYIHPYPVNKSEISGWTLNKTEVPLFLQALAKRSDYIELNAARNDVPNTEMFGWNLPAPKRDYIRDIQTAPSAPRGYVTDTHSIDEGYRFEVTPLISTNGEQAEILFSCRSTAIEKMHSFSLKVPTSDAPRQQLEAETPQIVQTEITDKISFPLDQVFLLDLGMVPMPEGVSDGKSSSISEIVSGKSIFKNVLVLIQKSDL